MWIVLRVVLATIGFLIRQRARGRTPQLDLFFEGTPYYERVHKAKQGIVGFTIGMARRSPTWIRLHAESRLDRWFKRLGVANEVQTGDEAFDRTVYVTCDHPFVAQLLTESAELRAAILAAFDAGYTRVWFDGATVSIEREARLGPDARDLHLLKTLWKTSRRLEAPVPSRARDPFLWKALVVEGVIWSLLGYAIGAGIELIAHDGDVHLFPSQIWKLGLTVAAIAFVILVGVVVVWMRGSSRGHRVIVESAVLLLLGLPAASVQLVGDTNRALDDASALSLAREIVDCEVRDHRGRRGRRSYSYRLHLAPDARAEGPRLPRTIQVEKALCDAAVPGATAAIDVAPGRWGIPWIRRIRVGDRTWDSPL